MKNNNPPAGFEAFDQETSGEPVIKPMKRNTKALQKKAAAHSVFPVEPNVFRVISGGSGREYRVVMFSDLTGNCNCDWAAKRPISVAENKGAVGCSHVLAVISHLAQADGRRISTWADVEQAKRQHKTVVSQADGLVITKRQGSGRRVQDTFFHLVDAQNKEK